MLIVCNCCICNYTGIVCKTMSWDTGYRVTDHLDRRVGYLEILLSSLGRPSTQSNRRTLTMWVPTSCWYSSASEKWEIVTLQKNNQNILTTGWNLRHLKASIRARVHLTCNDDEGNLNEFKWVCSVAENVWQILLNKL